MKCYLDYLTKKKLSVIYVEYNKVNNNFYKNFKGNHIYCYNPIEHELLDKLKEIYHYQNNKNNYFHILETINFLVKDKEYDYLRNELFKNSYNHNSFYIYQRRKLKILLDNNNNPLGGKWSYDMDNRKALPKNAIMEKDLKVSSKSNKQLSIPNDPKIVDNKYSREAISYTNKHFGKNYGELNFIYNIDHRSVSKWFDNFLENKLIHFGDYEDAISKDSPFIFHTIISQYMNVGLITDTIVINKILIFYNKNSKHIKLSCVEALIRQIIGWRNFMKVIYIIKHEIDNSKITNKNLFHKFWTGNTEIPIIDHVIKEKIVKYGYFHHIERLQLIGSFMKIALIDNDLIYQLFMSWTVDAFSFAMTLNVNGMLLNKIPIMRKRYIASSNYLRKMSSYPAQDMNKDIYDSLYYNYILINYNEFKNDYGLKFQIAYINKQTEKKKNEWRKVANEYLERLRKR
jgi:deoxyribodipyrimidine photolyase-related protein